MLPLIFGFILAVALSALLTTTEFAVFSIGESRLRMLSGEGFEGSRALARLREHPDRPLLLLRGSAILADVSAAVLAAAFAYSVWGGWTLALAATVVTGLLLLIARLVPMRIVTDHGVRFALAVAPGVDRACELVDPAFRLLERIVGLGRARSADVSRGVIDSQIRQITVLGRRQGLIEEHERILIERVFRLDETRAWDIMTPRVDVFGWSDAATLSKIAPQLHNVPFSRVPVYDESIDDITGVLYVRDAYQALVAGQRDLRLRDLARPPLTVPGSVPLTSLLRDFQNRRIHLAIIVDEYGGTDGLVTLEDVIEELVGEIVDETDIAEEPVTRISRNEIVAAGDAELREINHYFNTSLPQLEHRSLNGYLLEELGRVPETGETIERDGVGMEVLAASDTQVLRARLRRIRRGATPAEEPETEADTGADAATEAGTEAGAEIRADDGPER